MIKNMIEMKLQEQIEIVKQLLEMASYVGDVLSFYTATKELNGEYQEGWGEDIEDGERLLEHLQSELNKTNDIPDVIECVQFDADEIIAFLNDCETLDEAKMFADEHLR